MDSMSVSYLGSQHLRMSPCIDPFAPDSMAVTQASENSLCLSQILLDYNIGFFSSANLFMQTTLCCIASLWKLSLSTIISYILPFFQRVFFVLPQPNSFTPTSWPSPHPIALALAISLSHHVYCSCTTTFFAGPEKALLSQVAHRQGFQVSTIGRLVSALSTQEALISLPWPRPLD
jgi:hypothetical protein